MRTKNFIGFATLLLFLFIINYESISQEKQLRVSIFADDNNDPIPDATINADGGSFLGLFRGKSDQSGIATLIINKGDEYLVSVSHPKFLSAQQIIKINKFGDPQVYTLSFRLKRKDDIKAELNDLFANVRDKSNKPIEGALVAVAPGIGETTNSSGFAKAKHKQLPGEYILVTASAKGYKTQQKRVLVGAQQGNAITRPTDNVSFVLEKGENIYEAWTIVVEVLDYESDQPVSGANVRLDLSDGYIVTSSTNNKGEATLKNKDDDHEFSFKGTAPKVKVTHMSYNEKWSDIPEELMEVTDGSERRFVVFLKKKDVDWSGTFSNSLFSELTISDNGSNRVATYKWAALYDNGSHGDGVWKLKPDGNTATGTWEETFEDNDKTTKRSGTIKASLNGNSLSYELEENEPVHTWKKGTPLYQSKMRKGAKWSGTLTKKE